MLAKLEVPAFEFAFNLEKFSNMVLQIEVVAGDNIGGGYLPDSVSHNEPLRIFSLILLP